MGFHQALVWIGQTHVKYVLFEDKTKEDLRWIMDGKQ
jgi:hypothetical protein